MTQTKDWIYAEQSQDIFRKTEFYSLRWNIENMALAVASFGGPIAASRDLNKPDIRPTVVICSQAGQVISEFKIDDKSVTIGLGWTFSEDLIVVRENGEIYMYGLFGGLKNLFGVIKDAKAIDYRIFQAKNSYNGTYTTGVALLTSKKKFMIVKDVYDPKIQQFQEIPSFDFDTWCVVCNERKCFILASKGNDVYQLSIGSAPVSLRLNFGVSFSLFDKIVPSFDSELVALSTDNGHLIICSSDFGKVLHRYQSNQRETTKYLAWVANKAVVAYWDCLLLIPIDSESSNNHTEIYGYMPPIYFGQEIDGLRIISSEKNEFLQQVPKPLKDVFGIAAFESSSTLYEASIAFYEERNQKAEEYIRSIKERRKLEEAIANCITAAPYEYETKYQVELLRAALFGRYFDDYANASPYVKMCQTIRVLNAIRMDFIGLPLTYVQYETLTPSTVINRLISRRHFALAIQICKYLNMSNDEGLIKILSNWALYKVEQTHIEDDRIAVMIKSKLGDTPGISYAEIARCAISAGRPGLAIKLLEYETRASEQVPLYIEIGNAELALKKAMESGDSDLIYMVLFWYQNKFDNQSDFMKHISNNTIAKNLMLQYYRQKDTSTNELSNILNQENMVIEQVLSILRVAQKQNRIEQRLQMLDEARRLFGNEEKFNTSLIVDEIKLLKMQSSIDKNYRLQLAGKSLYETIAELIRTNIQEEAEKLRKEFKISDTSETWWHLKAKNLAKGHLWEELEKFSKSKKSVIGYEPFVTYCVQANSVQEAEKYYLKVPPSSRFACLLKMKRFSEALDIAFLAKDEGDINMVISKCNPSQRAIIDKAKSMKMQLAQR